MVKQIHVKRIKLKLSKRLGDRFWRGVSILNVVISYVVAYEYSYQIISHSNFAFAFVV